MSEVAITRADHIQDAVDEALGLLQLEGLIGMRLVAVKPNDTWASKDDTTAVTQGDTLHAVLAALDRLGPGQMVVSGGAGAAETEDVFRLSGMMAAVEAAGVELYDHNRPPFVAVPLDYGDDPEVEGPQREVMVNPRVFEYEVVVSLAQLKVHATATITGALKNIAMSFPAADYYGHPRADEENRHAFFDDMHSFIAAMCKRFPIQLAIIAGHPAMVGKGPIGGRAVETGLVIASRDPVAADTVAAKLLGFDAQAVRHIWEAARLGLGETDTKKMRFPGLSVEEAFAIFTEAVYGRPLGKAG